MKLGKAVTLIRGNTYKSSLLSETEGPVLLGLGSIEKDGGFKRGSWKHYPGESSSDILLHPGDLYVSLKDLTQSCNLLGAVSRVPVDIKEGRLTQDTVRLKFSPSIDTIDKLYIYWSLRTPQYRAYCKARGTGTTNMSLSRADFLDWEIPDKTEMKTNLVILLEGIEAKIELNNQVNDYLLELATVRFEQALISESDTFRFSELVELEDSKREPLNSRDRETRKGIYPYYGATSIMDYIDDYLFDGIRVLVGEDGTVIQEDGKPVLQYVWGKYWVNNHAHVLRSKSDYSLEAIYIALARTAISHIVTGAVQMKISQKNLNNLELEMPQPSSLRYLEDIFTLYRKSTEESKMLERLRDLLLPRLMSGEIDVSKIDITQLNNHLAHQWLALIFPLVRLKVLSLSDHCLL